MLLCQEPFQGLPFKPPFLVADVSISNVIDGEAKVKGSDAQRRKNGMLSEIGAGCGFFLVTARVKGIGELSRFVGLSLGEQIIDIAKIGISDNFLTSASRY